MNKKISVAASIAIGLLFFITQLSTTLYLPAMPEMVKAFGSSSHAIMLTISIFFLGYGLGQLFWGSLSDKYGRRPIILLALSGYTLSAMAVAFTNSFETFCLLYTLTGFMTAAYTSVGNAIVKETFGVERAAKAIAYIGVVMASGPIIGPIVGAHIVYWTHWQGIFVCLSLVALITLLLFTYNIAETHQPNATQQQKINALQIYASLFKNKAYMAFVLSLSLMFSCIFSFFTAAPFIFQDYLGLSPITSGELFTLTSTTYFLGAVFISQVIQKFGPYKLARAGMSLALVMTILLVSLILTHHLNDVGLVMILNVMLLGCSLVISTSKAGAMTNVSEHFGSAAALMKFSQIMFSVVFTAIAASLPSSHNILPISVLLLVICVVCLPLFIGFSAKKA